MICGNGQDEEFLVYRTSSSLTEFFSDVETDYAHDGSTRQHWVAETLEKVLEEPQLGPGKVPFTFARVIQRLMDPTDAVDEDQNRAGALGVSTLHWPGKDWRPTTPPTTSATYAILLPT